MYRLALTSLLAAAASLSAITVDEILDKMEENENPQTSRVEMTQKVYKADGRENVSRLISYSYDKGDKGLIEYIKPARIKGMKILMLNDGDDIWFYSPRTARVRKIASHQKKQSVNNSDFSYEDMSAQDVREDYNVKRAGEEEHNGVACYRLEATPKNPEDVSYSRTVTWVDKVKFIPVEAYYYDEDGELWKVLTVENAKKVGTYWSFESVTMKNVLKDSKTIMEMNKIENDIELDENMFSERYLRK